MDSSFLRDQQARGMRTVRLRVGLMVILLVGVVYAMYRFGQQSPREDTFEPDRPAVGRKVVESRLEVSGVDPAAGGKAPEPLTLSDEIIAQKFPFLKDPKVFDAIEDQGTDLEPNPFFTLLHRVAQETPEQLKAEAEKTGKLDWSTLWDKGKEIRGKAIPLTGRIVRVLPRSLGQNPTGLPQLTMYRIRAEGQETRDEGQAPEEDAEGPKADEPEQPIENQKPAIENPDSPPVQLFEVYTLEKLHGALPYDRVVTYGRFLKAQTIPPEPQHLLEDPDLQVAVLLARRLEPLTYLKDPEPPEPIVEGNRAEARALYWFLQRTLDVPAAELQKQAKTSLTYVDLTTQPERYRGTPVALVGEVRALTRIRLRENPLHLADVFYGQIVDGNLKMNTFYCHQIPDGIRLKDSVVLYGYFMKNWEYTSRDRELIKSPVFVGKHLRRLEYQRNYSFDIAVAVVALILLFILLYLHQREYAQQVAILEARQQRQLERAPKNLNEVARRLARAAGHAPTPAPPTGGEPPPQGPDTPDAPAAP